MKLKTKYFDKTTYKKYMGGYAVFLIAIFMCVVCVFMEMSIYAETVNRNLSKSVIRLHVIANSDSDEDQELKYAVRDFLLNEISNEAGNLDNVSDCLKYINENIDGIKARTKEFLKNKGRSNKVDVLIGKHNFPSKHYKDISFPAGNYVSLRVILGEGKGENWWCVLFPPLCFDGNTKGKLPEKQNRKLRESLNKEEYKIVTSENRNISYKLKFKIVEIFQNSQLRWSGLAKK